MSGIKPVFMKEMHKVFKEPKMIFSLFILPVIISVGMYGLIGFMAKNMMDDIEAHSSVVYIQDMPGALAPYFEDYNAVNQVDYVSLGVDADEDSIKTGIRDGSVDLYVVFPQNFMEDIKSYEAGSPIPDIATFYNPSEDYSKKAKEDFEAVMNGAFKQDILEERLGDIQILNVFTLDANNPAGVIVDTNKASGKMLAMLLPYLITMLLFAGTMSLGSDAIAGEKERGTMASMLLTPVNRISIALGKMLALTVFAMLSAAVYIVVLLVTMPLGIGMLSGEGGMSFALNVGQIVMVAVIMLILAFFYVSVVSVISVFAKDVKEAGSYISPVYIVVIIAGMMTMFSSGGHETFEYFIPVYNSAVALGEIFTGELTVPHFLMTIGTMLVLGLVLSKVIASAFNSEKIMFNS